MCRERVSERRVSVQGWFWRTGVSTSLAPGNWSGWYERHATSSFFMRGSVVLSGLLRTLAHFGHRMSRDTMKMVAVAMAAVVATVTGDAVQSGLPERNAHQCESGDAIGGGCWCIKGSWEFVGRGGVYCVRACVCNKEKKETRKKKESEALCVGEK